MRCSTKPRSARRTHEGVGPRPMSAAGRGAGRDRGEARPSGDGRCALGHRAGGRSGARAPQTWSCRRFHVWSAGVRCRCRQRHRTPHTRAPPEGQTRHSCAPTNRPRSSVTQRASHGTGWPCLAAGPDRLCSHRTVLRSGPADDPPRTCAAHHSSPFVRPSCSSWLRAASNSEQARPSRRAAPVPNRAAGPASKSMPSSGPPVRIPPRLAGHLCEGIRSMARATSVVAH